MSCYDFRMDTKTIVLAAVLSSSVVLAIVGTYYQTITLESFEYYTEDESIPDESSLE